MFSDCFLIFDNIMHDVVGCSRTNERINLTSALNVKSQKTYLSKNAHNKLTLSNKKKIFIFVLIKYII